jgi:hypothetical protein
MYCATEDGNFAAVDWAPPGKGTGFEKAGIAPPSAAVEGEGGAEDATADLGSFRVLASAPDHYRPAKSLYRSPFFVYVAPPLRLRCC